MKKKTSWVATAALMGLPLMAAAEANPADPSAAAPGLEYQSAFTDYKPWQDIKSADWRAVNDAVRDAKPSGAHGSHGATPPPAAPSTAPAPAASRQAPPAQPAASSRPAPAQAPGGHSGHGNHK